MNSNFYDVVVAKDYEVLENGKPVKKTRWNQVGTAWPSKNGNSLLFELFLIPGQRYVVRLRNSEETNQPQETASQDAPF